MNNLNDMTDLSWTQTTRAMSSLPLNRAKGNYKPMGRLQQRITQSLNSCALLSVKIQVCLQVYRG